MPVDYDTFRGQTWDERIAIVNAISADEKAELVRTHATRWLDEHRNQLSRAQILIVEENIAFVTPELYGNPSDDLVARMEDLQARTAAVLSREQIRGALTMHW